MTDAGFTVVQILRDPAQQTKVSSFLGFLSNIGIWFWVSAAALCFFSLLTNPLHSPYRTRELLLVLGLMSLLLAVDDMFMLHDRYIHQKSIFNFYAICCLILLFRHYARIVFINGFAFMFAGFLLALSIYIDTHQKKMGVDYSVHQLVEEGFKFVGAALWLYFCGQVASARARETNLDAD